MFIYSISLYVIVVLPTTFFAPVDGTNPQQGAENRQPLPNPWQRGGGGAAGGGTTGTGAAVSGPGLINTPGMQSLLQQMSENPRLMQSMLSAPYTNNMLQALAADPDMASQLINQVKSAHRLGTRRHRPGTYMGGQRSGGKFAHRALANE